MWFQAVCSELVGLNVNLRCVDSLRGQDGQISEEEFTESMLAWLQAVETPITKRRRASTDEESPNVRKRVHQQIASFFRHTGVRPDHAQLQQQILERGTDDLDMDSWRNSFQVATPEAKAALLDECRRIKEGGRESMQLKLHAVDPPVSYARRGSADITMS